MLTWKRYEKLQNLPDDIWNKISQGNICLSQAFMEIVELSNPDDSFIYYTASKGNEIVGVGFAYIKRFSIIPSLKWLGPRVLMTGTFQTYGKHYWVDQKVLDENTFLTLFYKELEKEQAAIYVIRDYVGNSHNFDKIPFFKKNHFVHITPYGVAFIELNHKYKDTDSFLASLKKKHKNTYKKMLRDREELNLTVSYDTDFDIESLYPLYLNVNANSKEFKTEPFSKEFFYLIKEKLEKKMLTILLKSRDKIIGFILIFEDDTQVIPFLLGIDYSYREQKVWHNLTLEAITYAINRDKKEIDLGLTSFELKKRLGAVKHDIHMFARFKSDLLNKLLGKYLKGLI